MTGRVGQPQRMFIAVVELLVGLWLQATVATPPDALMPIGHAGRVAPPPSPAGPDPSRVCDVTKFGAVGDNATEDTAPSPRPSRTALGGEVARCCFRRQGATSRDH